MGTIICYILDGIIFLFSLACILAGEATVEDYVIIVGTILFPAYDMIMYMIKRKKK